MASTGSFIWYDLATTDTAAAQAFYGDVIGWQMQDSGLADRSYTILSAGDSPVGGLMPLPEEARRAGASPGWMGYVGVDDVDAYAARVQQAGGNIHRAPEDIPGVGRFAVVADPQGAGFILFKGAGEIAPQEAAPGTPGHAGWRELHAADAPSAFDFYHKLFGWTEAGAVDMGGLGTYQMFATGAEPAGGMMTKMEPAMPPGWFYYFNVDSIQAAEARVKSQGGTVLHGPTEVPGGQWVLQGSDPQGARFALVGPHG